MKHLRRKRTTSESTSSSPIPPSISAPSPLSPPETPLYARFALNHRPYDGSAHKPIVSGPIALTPRKANALPPPLQRAPSLDSERARAIARERSRAMLKREGLEREEKGHVERVETARDREVRRMVSNGDALLARGADGADGDTPVVERRERPRARAEGERVLLPARKLTQKRKIREEKDGAQEDSAIRQQVAAPVESRSPSASAKEIAPSAVLDEQIRVVGDRVPLPARKVQRKRTNVGDEVYTPHPFPSSSSSSSALAPALPSPQAAITYATLDPDGWEDKFSTPKRPHLAAPPLKLTTSSSSQSGLEPTDLSTGSISSKTPLSTSTAGCSQRIRAAVVSQPSTSTSSDDKLSRVENQAHVVGDRVLLPARCRVGERSKDRSPERERLTTTQRSQRDVQIDSSHEDAMSTLLFPAASTSVTTGTRPAAAETARYQDHSSTPRQAQMDVQFLAKSSAQSLTSSSKPTEASSSTVESQPSADSAEKGRPPRRRKYSLLAAFGLPDSRTASDSDGSATNPHDAKPPTLATPAPAPAPSSSSTPSSLQPPAPAPPTAATLLYVQPGAASITAEHVTGAAIDSELVEYHPSTARRPNHNHDLQLQSLHLSGFDFPLGPFLVDSHDDEIPPMLTSTSVLPQLNTSVSKRRSIVDSPPILPPPSSSSSDPPVGLTQKAIPARLSPPESQSSYTQTPASTPPLPSPSAAATFADLPARPGPVPIQPQKAKSKAHIIDPDSSLLSPKSDTRYPLPSRRSPTNQASQPRLQKTSPAPNKTATSRASLPRLPPAKPEQQAISTASTQQGLVQGRPLIFAAMAAAEAEAEIMEPRAWMAVATFEPETQESETKTVQTEHGNGSSHFVNGYPTPRSASPKLPTATSTASSAEPKSQDDTRYVSPPPPQNSKALGNLPTPPATQPPMRVRKLSKSKSRVTRDASQPQTNGHTSNTLGAKPPTPVEDAPPARVRDVPPRSVSKSAIASTTNGLHASALGSPFQMREKAAVEPPRSVEASRPSPRVKYSDSPVPTRPVKILTERQMEKLSATKGMPMHGSNGPPPPQYRPDEPASVKSPSLRTKSLSLHTPSDDKPTVLQQSSSQSSNDMPAPPPKKRAAEDGEIGNHKREKTTLPEPPRSPGSAEEYAQARSRRRGKALEKDRPEGIEDVPPASNIPPDDSEPKEPTFYPIEKHIGEPTLFGQLIAYLSFADCLALSSASNAIRTRIHGERELTERLLERYLRTVGYARWAFPENEPLALTLTDLNAYMHDVSIPLHQFARYADAYLHPQEHKPRSDIHSLQAACRSYTRVVLRLRAQAEAEARAASAVARERARSPGRAWSGSTTSVNRIPNQQKPPSPKKSFSRSSSRAPSPTSMFSQSQHGHARSGSLSGQSLHHSQSKAQFHGNGSVNGNGVSGFQSPLFRMRRAPLLQVFVPSPEGDWLSDTSVLECEQELKRAGVLHLLRAGDVVWDTAVGDEANVGRLVWDGSYLIDLDYTYSRVGDLPKYIPTLAFPPSYFHRVVRTMGSGNPICHIDIAPWAEEIATNLQLLQDRMKSETPQGGHHMVVRWVHRSSFTIPPGKPLRIGVPKSVGPGPAQGGAWLVDPGWFGSVVVEAEGTNEGLADLQERCHGAFPIRAIGATASLKKSPERVARDEEKRSVFRILREKSRPSEIWIRTVTDKERLLPL